MTTLSTSLREAFKLGGVRAKVKGAVNALGDKVKLGADLSTAQTTIAQREDTIAAHVATIGQRDVVIAQHVATIAARDGTIDFLASFIGIKPEELSGKDATAARELVAHKISAIAVEHLAGAGVPPSALPRTTQDTSEPISKSLTYAEFSKLTPEGKMKFSTAGGRITD